MNRNVLLGGCEKAVYIIIVLSTFATLDDIYEQIPTSYPPIFAICMEGNQLKSLRKPQLYVPLLIQSPSSAAPIMDCRPPHISLVPALKAPTSCPMHHATIIPHHQISHSIPRHLNRILLLRRMGYQSIQQLIRVPFLQPLNMMRMPRHIKVHPAAWFMPLDKFVPSHFMLQRIDVGEEFRGSEFA